VNPAKASFATLTISAFASCIPLLSARQQKLPAPRFEISFAASARQQPITGRVFVMFAKKQVPEPRLQAGFWRSPGFLFGQDVSQLQPSQSVTINASNVGYPFTSLGDVPAGDYYVQGLINLYTQTHRSDGHAIWVHMDHWEGQEFTRSPGNLYSKPQRVHFDPAANTTVKLQLNQIIPPVQVPPDTKWVKRIKIQSKLISQFWGHPMYLGATLLLPSGYDENSSQRYPVIYLQDHFSLDAPFDFTDREPASGHREGYELYKRWTLPGFPRVIVITFQHPTPYFDDSYAVNSANNGPYGDALVKELIPYLEQHFRIFRDSHARTLVGGSTGGWESLALQVYHPDFFNGTWTFFPDPVDFRRYQLVNIYDDTNAFQAPGFDYEIPERPMMRTPEGQVVETVRGMSELEDALGSHGRSGQQYEAWEAVYGPVGPDGYPRPLWEKHTGKIDRDVANYMRDHGYDLRDYLSKNWTRLGPQLKGKLHLYCGDMDSFYLNLAVYLLQDFLKTTDSGATFEYGRPMKPHGWNPMTIPEMIKVMAGAMNTATSPRNVR
jgi:S-formylglutathione hydrolase FrmB